MPRRRSPLTAVWTPALVRSFHTLARAQLAAGQRTAKALATQAVARQKPPRSDGHWAANVAMGPGGPRRYRVFRPAHLPAGARVPLMVMLHGCGQDAAAFARSTRMNAVASREGFLVMYPEQDRVANAQGCWNWFETGSGRAWSEVASVLGAIDQACALYAVDRSRIALAGFSAGAGLAALLALRHPDRFGAVTMHSGVPPNTAHSGTSAMQAMRGRRPTAPLALRDGAGSPLPPLLVVQGAQDRVVAAGNGRAAAQAWAQALGARAMATRVVRRGERHTARQTDWRLGGRVAVSLVEVDNLAHAWSGGAASQAFGDPAGPDASRWAWSFSKRQFAR